MENKNLRRQAIEARSRARRLLLQLLYQYQLVHQDAQSLLDNRVVDPAQGEVDEQYLRESLEAIIKYSGTLDKKLAPFSKRKMRQLDPVERAILWIAAYEFLGRSDIPKTVILNEAIELAKKFGADDGYKFVNGILDKFTQAGHSQLNLEDDTQEAES